jgi:hypothetical protein
MVLLLTGKRLFIYAKCMLSSGLLVALNLLVEILLCLVLSYDESNTTHGCAISRLKCTSL